jgi:hypothetical protein
VDTLQEDRVTAKAIAGGSWVEIVVAAAAIAIAGVGLAGHHAFEMAAIATVAIGTALLVHGGAIATRWTHAANKLSGRSDDAVTSGVAAELAAGLAGVVLGLLAFAHVVPRLLLPLAAVVFGGALLLDGAAQPKLADVVHDDDPRAERTTHRWMDASGGAMIVVGGAALVLGLLQLVATSRAVELSLAATVAVGGALALAGFATMVKFARRALQLRKPR